MAQTSSSREEDPDTIGGQRPITGSDSDNRNAGFILVGMNHRSAPMEVRRQISFSKDLLPEALLRLNREASDGVILSTCSRTEIYTMGHNPERNSRRVIDFLHEFHGLEQGTIEPFLYTRTGNEAAEHLFNVAAGLDSVVLGEWQILDQVRQSLKAASNQESGDLPASLYRLFHGAVETGRQARIETGFGEQGTDLGQAVTLTAKSNLGDISGARVLVIGAGEIAKLTAQALYQAGVAHITIANRSMERGQLLADEVGGVAVSSTEIPEAILDADIIVSATGAPSFTVSKEMITEAQRHRPDRTKFIADLAVPADVDPQVASLERVRSLDIEQIQRSAVEYSGNSGNEAAAATVITHEGLDRFNHWLDSLDAAPHIRKLQQRAERIRQQELEKSLRKLTGLTDQQLAAIDMLTRSIVKKLLHEPIQALKESAGKYEPQGHALDSIREVLLPQQQ